MSDTFTDTFGIPWPRRTEARKRVNGLRTRALRLPLTLETKNKKMTAKMVLEEINKARETIYDRTKDNTARKKTVEDCNRICQTVEPVVAELEKINSDAIANDPQLLKTNKEAPENAKNLKLALAEALKLVKSAESELRKVILPEGFRYNELLATGAGIALHIDESIVDDTRKTELEKEITQLTEALAEAKKMVVEAEKLRESLQKKVEEYENGSAGKLRKALNGKTDGSPVLQKLDRLKGAVAQKGVQGGETIINKALIETLESELALLMSKLDKEDIAEHAKEIQTEVALAERAKEDRQKFNDALAESLSKLQALSGALNDENWHKANLNCIGKANTLGVPDKNGTFPDVDAAIKDAKKTVDQIIELEVRQLETARKAVLVDYQKAVDARKEKPIDTALTTMSVLAVERKQIDAQLAVFKDSYFAGLSKSPLDPSMYENLATARNLAKSVAERLAAIKTKATDFEKLEKEFAPGESTKDTKKGAKSKTGASLSADLLNDAIAGEKSPLGLYYPEDRKSLIKSLDELKADAKTLTAEQAAEKFKAWKAIYDKKKEEADKLKVFLDGIATPLKNCVEIYEAATKEKRTESGIKSVLSVGGRIPGGGLTEPNALFDAIEQVKLRLKKTPPPQDELQVCVDQMKQLFAKLTTKTPKETIKVAELSVQGSKDKASTDKSDKKDKTETLMKRLSQIKMERDTAGDEVSKVNGDTLALDAIDKLLATAKAQIKKKKFKEAAATLDRASQRTDMLLAHPEGEVNRTRKELPKLFTQWRASLKKARASLTLLTDQIKEFDPSSPPLLRLIKLIEDYRDELTGDPAALEPVIIELASDKAVPEAGRRKAREQALAFVQDRQMALQMHPLSAKLATSPFPDARKVPGQLATSLGRLTFTLLTAVK